MDEYKGYTYFNDIDDAILRSYNRAQIVYNLHEMDRDDLLEGYMEGLSKAEQTKLVMMMMYINEKGKEEVSKEVAQRVEVVDE